MQARLRVLERVSALIVSELGCWVVVVCVAVCLCSVLLADKFCRVTWGNTDMGGKRGKRVSQKPQTGKQVCGTCSRDPGDNPIVCDECEVWVHGTEMCSGLHCKKITS